MCVLEWRYRQLYRLFNKPASIRYRVQQAKIEDEPQAGRQQAQASGKEEKFVR